MDLTVSWIWLGGVALLSVGMWAIARKPWQQQPVSAVVGDYEPAQPEEPELDEVGLAARHHEAAVQVYECVVKPGRLIDPGRFVEIRPVRVIRGRKLTRKPARMMDRPQSTEK